MSRWTWSRARAGGAPIARTNRGRKLWGERARAGGKRSAGRGIVKISIHGAKRLPSQGKHCRTVDCADKRPYWVPWSWLARLRPLVQRKRPGSEEACDARVELLADGDRPRPDRRLRRRPGGDDPAGTKDAGPSGGGELPGAQRAQRLPGTQRVGGPRGHALLPYAGPPHGDHPGIQARLRRGL